MRYSRRLIARWTDKPEYEPAPPVAMNPWYEGTVDTDDPYACYVYLIATETHYKIGISRQVNKRLSDINTSLAKHAELVAVRLGGRELEAQLHDELDHYRADGEWFLKCPQVFAAFMANREEVPVVTLQEDTPQPLGLPLFDESAA